MPYYQRSGMISHRHPFYGAWDTSEESVWGTQDENDQNPPPPTSTGTLPPLPPPPPVVESASPAWLIPALIAGGAILIFWLTLKKGK